MTIRHPNSVLVTGAQGFLGRALTALLKRSGTEVIALDSAAAESLSSDRTATVVCDITNKDELERVFQDKEIGQIVHLAAILPTAAQRDPLRATQVNIDGSLNLLEMARRTGIRRFLFGSSLSIYGTCAADQVVSEEDRAAPEDVYGAAKLYVEQLGCSYAASTGLEFVSLRIGRIVGAGARSTTSAWRGHIFEFLRTDRPADIALPYVGSERVLLVHVDDAARALRALLQAPRPAHPIYNAPCESWVENDLKQQVESLNPNIRVTLGTEYAKGNPRLLDFSRFQKEFGLANVPIAERLEDQQRSGLKMLAQFGEFPDDE
jgi:UDP-glucuronate 4-epimerase